MQLAAELIERAKAEGVSRVGPDGLPAGITKTVLQAALEAEMLIDAVYVGDPRRSGGRPARLCRGGHQLPR
ncbi:hypothetical protein [Actinomadura sp. NTSP31]|uniref:hypothetical protein n=1 Tax=Actinomadura sp. NTSP31 TaxID=1735447 RepID=UPI0035C1F577